MTFRQRVARALRKWADLIDPRTPPRESRDSLNVRVGIEGVDEFEAQVAKLRSQLDDLRPVLTGISSTLVPAPLQRGCLYVVQATGRLRPEGYESIQRELQKFTDKFGCEFMVIDDALSVTPERDAR